MSCKVQSRHNFSCSPQDHNRQSVSLWTIFKAFARNIQATHTHSHVYIYIYIFILSLLSWSCSSSSSSSTPFHFSTFVFCVFQLLLSKCKWNKVQNCITIHKSKSLATLGQTFISKYYFLHVLISSEFEVHQLKSIVV